MLDEAIEYLKQLQLKVQVYKLELIVCSKFIASDNSNTGKITVLIKSCRRLL